MAVTHGGAVGVLGQDRWSELGERSTMGIDHQVGHDADGNGGERQGLLHFLDFGSFVSSSSSAEFAAEILGFLSTMVINGARFCFFFGSWADLSDLGSEVPEEVGDPCYCYGAAVLGSKRTFLRAS